MKNLKKIIEDNQNAFQNSFAKGEGYYYYPDGYLVRIYHRYLKDRVSPDARILDFGFGSGNNSMFFLHQGYELFGIDVAPSALALLEKNLADHQLNLSNLSRFQILPVHWRQLPYASGFFDCVLANHVLYYYPSKEEIGRVCRELSRCLRPGGTVIFTMNGSKQSQCSRLINPSRERHSTLYQIDPNGKTARLNEIIIFLANGENELIELFSDFEPIDIGYHDQSIFEINNMFKWIFVGQKPGTSPDGEKR